MRVLLVLSLLSLCISISGCAKTMPVYTVTDVSIYAASGKQLTLAQVGDVITKAAKDKGWLVNRVSDGLIEATIHARRHTAVVDIQYTATSYDISYKNSENLLYDGKKIHRNYNKWIMLLERKINEEVNNL